MVPGPSNLKSRFNVCQTESRGGVVRTGGLPSASARPKFVNRAFGLFSREKKMSRLAH